MANSYFQFKHFTIWHDKCAMKVGTDGVLLGAWVQLENARQVLDIGSGSGLIALIIAQRGTPDTQITAIEIDREAANQATENANKTMWKDNINVICTDFCQFEPGILFDLIVSNPPYFSNALKSPDSQRAKARHNNSLPFETLIRKSASMLTENGKLALIIPFESWETVKLNAIGYGLYPEEVTRVSTISNIPPKRILVRFGKKPTTCNYQTLSIEKEKGIYTEEYRKLVQDFYLTL